MRRRHLVAADFIRVLVQASNRLLKEVNSKHHHQMVEMAKFLLVEEERQMVNRNSRLLRGVIKILPRHHKMAGEGLERETAEGKVISNNLVSLGNQVNLPLLGTILGSINMYTIIILHQGIEMV
jgi:hypothetical protein